MTFDARESSAFDGQPVEVFLFQHASQVWMYTSAERDREYLSQTWTATHIIRGNIEMSSELARHNMTLEVPRNFPVAEIFRVAPPSQVIQLTVHRLHVSDGETHGVVIWVGRVMSCDWGELTATLSCEPITTSQRRNALRRTYGRNCPHALYDGTPGSCRVSAEAFKVETTAGGVSGATVTAAAFGALAAGWLRGGYLEYQANGVTHRRMIIAHVADAITLSLPAHGLAVGGLVSAFPGCDRTMDTCRTKFGNLDNYGGFPWVPRQNPMGGSTIF